MSCKSRYTSCYSWTGRGKYIFHWHARRSSSKQKDAGEHAWTPGALQSLSVSLCHVFTHVFTRQILLFLLPSNQFRSTVPCCVFRNSYSNTFIKLWTFSSYKPLKVCVPHKHTGSQPVIRNTGSCCLLIENPNYLRIRKQLGGSRREELKNETERAFLDWREHNQNVAVIVFFTLRFVLPGCWNHLSNT